MKDKNSSSNKKTVANNNHAKVPAPLLANSADKNKATKDSVISLYNACRDGDVETVGMLLDYGAEINKANNGVTPLITACLNGHAEIVAMLLENENLILENTQVINLVLDIEDYSDGNRIVSLLEEKIKTPKAGPLSFTAKEEARINHQFSYSSPSLY